MGLSVYYHTHWDREWYLPFRTFQLRLADVVDEILERLETGVLPCFTLDGQVIVLDDYLALRPENRERLRTLIESGRLDIGPWLVMPDEFLVGGESLLRNLTEGIRRSKDWGCHRFTGYLPDTFGHSADIPTLLQQCGISSAVVWRGVQPESSLFRWESPSGATVQTLHLTDGYFQIAPDDWTLTDAEKTDALKTLFQKLEAARQDRLPVLMPVGGDHMAPVPAEGRQLLLKAFPDAHETTPATYMESLPGTLSTERLQGELADNRGSFLLPGVASARLYLKQANRRLEHFLTRRLEPLLAITQLAYRTRGLTPPRYPQHELALAWETLILNHPHDSICGCSVDAVHRENEVRFEQVQQIAESLFCRAERQLVRAFPQACRTGWIINTGSRPYTGVVEITEAHPMEPGPASFPGSLLTQVAREDIVLQDEYRDDPHRIPLAHLTERRRTGWVWVEEVPAFGICSLKPEPALPSRVAPVTITTERLENDCLQVRIEADGTLCVTDRQSGNVYRNLLHFQDRQDQGDSYNSAPVPGDKPLNAEFIGARILAEGPLVGILILEHRFPERNLHLLTQVRLAAGSGRLDFETTFMNAFSQHKLQVGFSTGQPIERVLAESHFSQVERRYDPAYEETAHMPVDANRELKTNTGSVQRFFSANGHSWITEGLTEYEVSGDVMKITLLRSFTMLSAANTGVRGAQAGPPLDTPEGACLYRTSTARYAWLPTPSAPVAAKLDSETSRFYGDVYGYRCCLEPTPDSQSDPNSGESLAFSLVQWDTPEAIPSACYWRPERGFVLRLLNTDAEAVSIRLQTGFPCQQFHRLNFLEEQQETVSSVPGSAYTLSLHGNAAQTLLFETTLSERPESGMQTDGNRE